MQKTSKKASILIWSTFLSLIITVTFISISTSINKNLKNNALLTSKFNNENQIQNIINSGSINSLYKSQYLDNGDKIVFNYSNMHEVSLKKGGTHSGVITTLSNINIKIIEGGPVEYNHGSTKGIIHKIDTFSSPIGTFNIKNLGGYTKILITSDTTENHLSQYRKYTVYKKIGNKEVIQKIGIIKNF